MDNQTEPVPYRWPHRKVRLPLFTLCGVWLCSLRSITNAAHPARPRPPDAHAGGGERFLAVRLGTTATKPPPNTTQKMNNNPNRQRAAACAAHQVAARFRIARFGKPDPGQTRQFDPASFHFIPAHSATAGFRLFFHLHSVSFHSLSPSRLPKNPTAQKTTSDRCTHNYELRWRTNVLIQRPSVAARDCPTFMLAGSFLADASTGTPTQ